MSSAWTISENGVVGFPSSPVSDIDLSVLDTPVGGRPIQPRYFFPIDPREGMLAITHDPIVFSPGKAPIDPQLLLLPPPALPDFGPGTVAPVRAETDAGHEEPIGSPIGIPEPEAHASGSGTVQPSVSKGRAGGKVASRARTQYTRLLPKNTGVPSFQYTPIMGTPTDGVKVAYFEDYLKTLLLEAPQPIPIDKINKIIAECWGIQKLSPVTKNLISQALTQGKDTFWVKLQDGNERIGGHRWWHMTHILDCTPVEVPLRTGGWKRV